MIVAASALLLVASASAQGFKLTQGYLEADVLAIK